MTTRALTVALVMSDSTQNSIYRIENFFYIFRKLTEILCLGSFRILLQLHISIRNWKQYILYMPAILKFRILLIKLLMSKLHFVKNFFENVKTIVLFN